MAFYSEEHLNYNRQLSEADLEVGFADYLGATIRDAWHDNPTVATIELGEVFTAQVGRDAIADIMGDSFDTETDVSEFEPTASPALSLEDQQAIIRKNGLEKHIKAQEGYNAEALNLVMESKREELERQVTLQAASDWYAPAGFIAGLGTSFLDPINVASNFIPGVGQTRALRMLQEGAKQGAKGLALRRAAIGAAEGAVGSVVVEPLVAFARSQQQADYGMTDSLLNVAFGTVMGATLHPALGAWGDYKRHKAMKDNPLITEPWETVAPTDKTEELRFNMVQDVMRAVREAGADISEEQAYAAAALFDARARTVAYTDNIAVEDYYDRWRASFLAGASGDSFIAPDLAEGIGADLDPATRPDEPVQEAPVEAPAVSSEPIVQPVPGRWRGSSVSVLTPQGEDRGYYELRELYDIIASHDPDSDFARRADYPEGAQERPYHSDQNEKDKVFRNAMTLDPRYLVNDNPDAVNGPPVITENGVVLGGNSRTMSIQLAYGRYADRAELYKQALRDKAALFGIDASAVDNMTAPVLVRVVEGVDTPEAMALRSRLYNQSMTQGINRGAEGVSRGRLVSPDSINILASGMEEGETLRSWLGTADGKRFVQSLINDGVLEQTQLGRLLDENGALTDEGKALVEKTLRGLIVPDADLLRITAPSVLNKLDGIVPAMLRLKARGEGWDISKHLAEALEKLAEAQNMDVGLDILFGQGSLLSEQGAKPAVQAIAYTLKNATPTETKLRFNLFAEAAYKAEKGQGSLLASGPTPADGFIRAFLGSVAKVGDKGIADFNPAGRIRDKAILYAWENGGKGHSIETATQRLAEAMRKGEVGEELKESAHAIMGQLANMEGSVQVFGPKMGERFRYRGGETLFQFLGERGASALDAADEASFRMDNLSIAREMEQAGKDAAVIKLATGWERGADGKWRYEISDADAEVRVDEVRGSLFEEGLSTLEDAIALKSMGYTPGADSASFAAMFEERFGRKPFGEAFDYADEETVSSLMDSLNDAKAKPLSRHIRASLGEILNHPDLFAAYPGLADVEISTRLEERLGNYYGYYSSSDNLIWLNPDILDDGELLRTTILHEVQHAIQRIEGFDLSSLPKGAKYSDYLRLASENEAFNTGRRMRMSYKERLESLASSTEDVARKDQIFLRDSIGRAMASIDENIENGTRALERLLAQKDGVAAQVMFRNGVGYISFLWGKPGTEANGFHDGYGISHIIAARNAQGDDGEAVARKLVEVIAKGDVITDKRGNRQNRVTIRHDGYVAILSKHEMQRQKIWLLTGYEKTLPGDKQAVNAQQATQQGQMDFSDQVGAGRVEGIIPDNASGVNALVEAARKQNSINTLLQRAWHGTPHNFDAFTLQAIGTGEGAQAHGWGLYFAKNKTTAKRYKTGLSKGKVGRLFEVDIPENNVLLDEQKAFFAQHKNVQKLILEAIQAMSESEQDVFYKRILGSKLDDSEAYNKATAKLDRERLFLKAIMGISDSKVVRIWHRKTLLERGYSEEQIDELWADTEKAKAEIQKFLPEVQRLEAEQKALKQKDDERRASFLSEAKSNPEATLAKVFGEQLYDAIAWAVSKENYPDFRAASEALNAAGIKGITYMGGQDGRCFVVFDDQSIQILDKLYQIIGEKGAARLDRAREETVRTDNLAVAVKMAAEGKDDITIRLATGWEQGVDGKWRYEIPDGRLDFSGLKGKVKPDRYTPKGAHRSARLKDVLIMPDLYAAYPEIADIRVFTQTLPRQEAAAVQVYSDGTKVIVLNSRYAKPGKPTDEILSNIVHEVQHVIQSAEGFIQGSNPKKAGGVDRYMEVAGEAEARNAEGRMGFTPEERNTFLLSATSDVPAGNMRTPDGKPLRDPRLPVEPVGPLMGREPRHALPEELPDDYDLGLPPEMPDAETPRGMVEFNPNDGKAVVTFFKNADASTLPHEMFHIFRRELADTASREGASPQSKDMWARVCEFVGAKEGEKWTVEQEEMFARAGERYLLEGKAPNVQLRGVFERMKQWFMEIYTSVDAAGLEISDTMRQVFGDMFRLSPEEADMAFRYGFGRMLEWDPSEGTETALPEMQESDDPAMQEELNGLAQQRLEESLQSVADMPEVADAVRAEIEQELAVLDEAMTQDKIQGEVLLEAALCDMRN